MHKPFFSIVTPVYNGSQFVYAYIQSLLGQSFVDWESIVVDDNSVDDTFDKLVSAVNHDQRFKVYRVIPEVTAKTFPGPYNARNVALAHATGKFICFLDIDDYWLPCKLSDQFSLLDKNRSLKLIYSQYYKMNSSLSKGYLKPRLDVLPIKLQISFWNPIPMLTSCIAHDMAKTCRFQPIGHEDYLYWSAIIKRLDESSIACSSRPAALYRCSNNSQSRNKLNVLSWWINCYRKKGFPVPAAFVLLGLRIIMEIVETILAKLGFFGVWQPSTHNCIPCLTR